MEITMKDVMAILDEPESSIIKYIKTKKLPAHKINHQYRFNKEELKEWVIRNGITVSAKFLDMNLIKNPVVISGLVKKGGIFSGIQGDNVRSILASAVGRMHMPAGMERETVLASLVEREEMMPTAVGRGIAIPHPRNPIISEVDHEAITLCMLEKPSDFGAMDGRPVHTLFIVTSANSRRHLEILSKLLFLCQQQDFISLLEAKAQPGDIINYITAKESSMKERG